MVLLLFMYALLNIDRMNKIIKVLVFIVSNYLLESQFYQYCFVYL